MSFLLLNIVSLKTKHSADEDVTAYFFSLKAVKDPTEQEPVDKIISS